MDPKFLDTQVADVRRFFSVFAGPPELELTPEGDCIFIEKGGISIMRSWEEVQALSSTPVHGFRYRVYNHEGEDDGNVYIHLFDAVKAAMGYYADELFRRIDDQIVTAAQAEEFIREKVEGQE